MAEREVPVDPHNPGQVFAALGLVEAAETVLGEAEGGFAWGGDGHATRFRIRAPGHVDPVEAVLDFLVSAELRAVAPREWTPKFEAGDKGRKKREAWEHRITRGEIELVDFFPGPEPDSETALPVRLQGRIGERVCQVTLGHWAEADGFGRDPFKLYAGNRSAHQIMSAMIQGQKGGSGGIRALLAGRRQALLEKPFDELIEMGGSFNFDARAAWNALDAGFSLNEHADIRVVGSPVVEVLAAWGLQNARPARNGRNESVRYSIWRDMLPLALARPSLAGVVPTGVGTRSFVFVLGVAGRNRIVQFAEEEPET